MERSCERCGAARREGAAFCGACGAPLTNTSGGSSLISGPDAERLVPSVEAVASPEPASKLGTDRIERAGRRKGKRAVGAESAGPVPLVGAGGGAGGGSRAVGGGSGGDGSSRRWLWVVTALGVLIALVATIATVVIIRSDRSRPMRVTLEPIDTPSSHPFTDSVVKIDPADARRFAEQARKDRPVRSSARSGDGRMALGSVKGDHPGVYGSRAAALCDTTELVDQLRTRPAVARAWAQLVGITVDRIPATIDRLTPVLLTHDTAVTNSEYRDGQPRTFPAILEAGTAVLVDDHGQPRVKCSCGNPLRPTTTAGRDINLTGDPWTGFRTDQVVTVTPTPKPVTTLPTVDVTTGDDTVIGTGGTVTLDGYLVVDHQGVHVISEDGKQRTTVIDHEVAQAFDDGAGGIIYNELQPLDEYGNRASSDRPASRTRTQAAIWHLPAGAGKPVPLVGSDHPDRRWSTVEATGTLGGRRVMAYTTAESLGGKNVTGRLLLRDLQAGQDRTVADPGFWHQYSTIHPTAYKGVGLYSVTIGGDRLGYVTSQQAEGTAGSSRWVVLNAQLKELPTACSKEVSYDSDHAGCTSGAFADVPGSPEPVLFGFRGSGTGESVLTEVTDLGTGRAREFPGVGSPYLVNERWSLETDAFRGRGVASFLAESETTDPQPAALVDLKTGKATNLPFAGLTRFLRAPIIRPKGGAPLTAQSRTPTSTTTAVRNLETVSDAELVAAAGCDCAIISKLVVEHPTFGKSILVWAELNGGGGYGSELALLDGSLRKVWGAAPDGTFTGGLKLTTDKSNNVFFTTGTGSRWLVVVVLRPNATGYSGAEVRRDDAPIVGREFDLMDADKDGIYEVVAYDAGCDPSCDEGAWTRSVYRWNGSQYVRTSTEPYDHP